MFLPNKISSTTELYLIEGNTSFSRQHHSTNTLGDQHVLPEDYVFYVRSISFIDFICFLSSNERIIMYH